MCIKSKEVILIISIKKQNLFPFPSFTGKLSLRDLRYGNIDCPLFLNKSIIGLDSYTQFGTELKNVNHFLASYFTFGERNRKTF